MKSGFFYFCVLCSALLASTSKAYTARPLYTNELALVNGVFSEFIAEASFSGCSMDQEKVAADVYRFYVGCLYKNIDSGKRFNVEFRDITMSDGSLIRVGSEFKVVAE